MVHNEPKYSLKGHQNQPNCSQLNLKNMMEELKRVPIDIKIDSKAPK